MTHEELGKRIREVAYLEGDFILSSGRHSKYYLDKYLFSTRPELLRAIAKEFAARVPEGTQRIAGAEIGGVPLAAAVSLETDLPFIIVKKQSKDYGTKKEIEGVLLPGENVVLVEDIMTTASQAIRACRIVEKAGGKILALLGVIDREEDARENVAAAGFPYGALFTKTELGV